MNEFLIAGIQQVGVGTTDFTKSWQWYIDNFGTDVRVLEDDTVAERMLKYTGGQSQKRHACIAINLNGGGGFEIWQYSNRKPQPIGFEINIGDLGVFAAKLKCSDVEAFHKQLSCSHAKLGEVTVDPAGTPCFYMEDPFGNYFQVVQDKSIYIQTKSLTGGMVGAMIGVTDIEKARTLYSDVLGYDTVVYDRTGEFTDWKYLRGSEKKYRRVLLKCSKKREGAFSELFGESTIELVCALESSPRKIFEGRYWGDPGFIQVCFDITNLDAFKEFCARKGYPFTVDSGADGEIFDMGNASGRFAYVEDPDGSLIELVETRKIPILEKANFYLDLTKRDPRKPLPKFLFRLLGLTRIKKLK